MVDKLKQVHFIGIGGIGMSGAAKFLKLHGVEVSGSDLVKSNITDELVELGLEVTIGSNPELVQGADLVIYSSAVPEADAERTAAKHNRIKELSYFDFLGELSKEYETIVISGTNGKSTTTAMLAEIMIKAGLDPTVIVGSLVPGWKHGNVRVGQSKYFLVEGCEYEANMLKLNPDLVVLTNIEEDHLDFYRDINHIRETFQTLVDKLPKGRQVVRNYDDPQSTMLEVQRDLSFGIEHTADVMAENRTVVEGVQQFDLLRGSNKIAELELTVPGEFNVMNALAATAAAFELGISTQDIVDALAEFKGIWRRFERVGEVNGAEIISDYAHHPTAIANALEAAKEFFPKRRIVLCFQPHQHSRTIELFDEFVSSFDLADGLVLSEIYAVKGREETEKTSSEKLVKAVRVRDAEQGRKRTVEFASDLESAREAVSKLIEPGDVVIVMGAGDVDEVARGLIKP